MLSKETKGQRNETFNLEKMFQKLKDECAPMIKLEYKRMDGHLKQLRYSLMKQLKR